MILIERIHGTDLEGKSEVSLPIQYRRKPIANLLVAANATVTNAHSKTPRIEAVCRQADILVAAVGRSEMVKADWMKPGATVIDFGINRVPAAEASGGKSRLVGNVDFKDVFEQAGRSHRSPVG